jgi:hypothetical protein
MSIASSKGRTKGGLGNNESGESGAQPEARKLEGVKVAMVTRQHRAGRLKRVGVVSVLVGMLSGGCSSPPPLREEELLKLLGEMQRVGEHQFRQHIWPRLEKKTITYCGRADEVKVLDTGSVVLIPVEKTYAGEKLPWLLEGKTVSPDVVRPYKPGETLCMTGTLENFMEIRDRYWGSVKLVSLEKAPAS